MEDNQFAVTDSPLLTGVAIGGALSIFQTFIQPVGVPLAAFLIVGIVLTLFGEQFWPAIGLTFVSTSISSAVILGIIGLIFEGLWL